MADSEEPNVGGTSKSGTTLGFLEGTSHYQAWIAVVRWAADELVVIFSQVHKARFEDREGACARVVESIPALYDLCAGQL
jgi:hypothetical protein